MDRLDLAGACNALPPFIEALNNWYIRRSRDRFWKSGEGRRQAAAYDTLYTVLVTLTRTMAPFLPFLTDHIHRALCDGESVHLQDWPDASAFAVDAALVERMDLARAGRLGGGLDPHGEEPAQPPAAGAADRRASAAIAILEPLRDVIAEEANVKEVALRRRPVDVRLRSAGGQSAHRRQAARPGDEGRPRRRQGRRLEAAVDDGAVEVAGNRIEPDEYELRFQPNEGLDAAPLRRQRRRRRARHQGHAGAGARGPGARLHPPGAGRPQGRRLQRVRPHRHRGEGGARRRGRDRRAPRRGQAARRSRVSLDTADATPAGTVSEAKLGDEPIAIGVRVAA